MSETRSSPRPRNMRINTSAIAHQDMQLAKPNEPASAVSTAIITLSNLPQSRETFLFIDVGCLVLNDEPTPNREYR